MVNLIIPAGTLEEEAYEIDNSIIFDKNDSSYMTRTPSVAGNRKTFTFACWIKRCNIGLGQIFNAGAGVEIQFNSSNKIAISGVGTFVTSGVFADPSYHMSIILAVDTTQSTDTDRLNLYIDGNLITDFDTETYPSLNLDTGFNNTVAHHIGSNESGGENIDSYFSETVMIDGYQLVASDFGFPHSENSKVFVPKNISGLNYTGTNSFHLDFKDDTSTTTLGYDVSGNNNHFTTTNFTVGDQSVDTPTYNICTLNPLDISEINANFFIDDGNKMLNSANNSLYRNCSFTINPENLKGYYEFSYENTTPNGKMGFILLSESKRSGSYTAQTTMFLTEAGQVRKGATNIITSCTPSFSIGDIGMLAFDFTNGNRYVWFGRNGTWGQDASSNVGDPENGLYPHLTATHINEEACHYSSVNNGSDVQHYFDSTELTYTPPTGFDILASANMQDPDIAVSEDYFDVNLYTGNGATRTISTENKVDNLVIKNRDQADEWKNVDSVRGATNELNWDSNAIESVDANGVTAFGGSTGFDLGTGANGYNDSAEKFVSYAWTESANASHDIVAYTGDGTLMTIPHSLGVTPEFIIVKNRDSLGNWHTRFPGFTVDEYQILSTNSAKATYSDMWETLPDSTNFYVGSTSGLANNGDDYIAYLWSSVPGFSKIFTYKGNASTLGPFVFCDFKPKFILLKNVDAVASWLLFDIKRNTYNSVDKYLSPDVPNAEATSTFLNIVHNGFKVISSSATINGNTNIFWGIAFAEFPFKFLGGNS